MFLGKSDVLSEYFRTTSEREYPGAPTQISLPGVNSTICYNLIQYMYTVSFFKIIGIFKVLTF